MKTGSENINSRGHDRVLRVLRIWLSRRLRLVAVLQFRYGCHGWCRRGCRSLDRTGHGVESRGEDDDSRR